MADASAYARRFWRNSTRLRELDRDGGDPEDIQDCINELTANVLHAPSADIRRRSQAALDAHYRHQEAAQAHGTTG